jgi:putative molybdopterin biosynthesis protein
MFRKLVSLDEAKKRIADVFSPKPLGIEKVSLLKAVRRVLAEDVVSPIDVPPFHRSTVDGYAVKAEDTFGAEEDNPVMLKLVGCVDVGEFSSLTIENGDAVEIVTGAPLPTGVDAVVMVEHTTEKDGKIFVYKPVAKNENIMVMGSDIRKNETVLKRGNILSSRELGVLAALGFNQVKVFKQPKVAVVSTGAEIVEPGKTLPLGKIYDINTYTLTAAVLESGGEPVDFGIVKDDDVESLRMIVRKAVDVADVVVTSGGVSVGPKDVVPRIINELGKPGLVVHGVAVKPGKPVAVAVVDNKPIFSLPGNPTSSLLMFHLLVRPVLFKMVGKKEKFHNIVKAITTAKLFSARGRRTFITVTLSRDNRSRWLASPVPTGQSGAITTLAKADGYVELKETQQFIDAGKEVTVSLFKPLED